jgi:voltage-gated potassium channel
VITLVVPMLRPVRALRAVVAVNVLVRRGRAFTRGRVVVSVVAAVGVTGFVAAVAMLDAERDNPEANIKSFGDAAWWALTTATTVGYGERYPTTTEGRFVAAGLMLVGVALLGVVTAALASWFVDKVSEVRAAEERTEDRVDELVAEVRALRQELREASGRGDLT